MFVDKILVSSMAGLNLGQLRALAKEYGMEYGREFVVWAQKNGILKDPTNIHRKNNERIAQQSGFKNHNEYELNRCHKDMEHKRRYIQEWRHENGINQPMSDNEDCSLYLGTFIAKRKYGRMILPEMFGGIEKEMLLNNPWYDFIVTGDVKIDIKSCCLRELKGWKGWEPKVRWNNVTDYFVILAFDNRTDLNLMHIWSIQKDEIIRGYKFYMRNSIKITNKHRHILTFKRFEWTDKLGCLKNQII